MKTYIVTYRYVCEDRWEIKADSKKEAIEKAFETDNYTTFVIRRFAFKAVQKNLEKLWKKINKTPIPAIRNRGNEVM